MFALNREGCPNNCYPHPTKRITAVLFLPYEQTNKVYVFSGRQGNKTVPWTYVQQTAVCKTNCCALNSSQFTPNTELIQMVKQVPTNISSIEINWQWWNKPAFWVNHLIRQWLEMAPTAFSGTRSTYKRVVMQPKQNKLGRQSVHLHMHLI